MTQPAIEVQNKDVVRRYWNGKWNERRSEILDELLTPDVAYHGPSMSMNGREEYKQVYNVFRSALHDTRLEIDDLIAEGDKVVSRVSLQCVHGGEFEGLPPTGREIALDAYTVFRLVDGKIAEEWEIIDELGMMRQIGMELTPGQADPS
jgi:steroid delta-isomerase-like uncharacterized protein